jgi:hypothetical protein
MKHYIFIHKFMFYIVKFFCLNIYIKKNIQFHFLMDYSFNSILLLYDYRSNGRFGLQKVLLFLRDI